jgi:hypothetical protein
MAVVPGGSEFKAARAAEEAAKVARAAEEATKAARAARATIRVSPALPTGQPREPMCTSVRTRCAFSRTVRVASERKVSVFEPEWLLKRAS